MNFTNTKLIIGLIKDDRLVYLDDNGYLMRKGVIDSDDKSELYKGDDITNVLLLLKEKAIAVLNMAAFKNFPLCR